MKVLVVLVLAGIAAIALTLFSRGARAELLAGQGAPNFSLVDQSGNTHRLSDYRGKWVVLYFYPKDDTPGCTTEACNFRDDIFRIRELGAEVVGVSVDAVDSHARFAEKHGLPFPLLADVDGTVADQYGSLTHLGPIRFASRHTFIVAPDGTLARVYRKVDAQSHSAQVIADLGQLQSVDR